MTRASHIGLGRASHLSRFKPQLDSRSGESKSTRVSPPTTHRFFKPWVEVVRTVVAIGVVKQVDMVVVEKIMTSSTVLIVENIHTLETCWNLVGRNCKILRKSCRQRTITKLERWNCEDLTNVTALEGENQTSTVGMISYFHNLARLVSYLFTSTQVIDSGATDQVTRALQVSILWSIHLGECKNC